MKPFHHCVTVEYMQATYIQFSNKMQFISAVNLVLPSAWEKCIVLLELSCWINWTYCIARDFYVWGIFAFFAVVFQLTSELFPRVDQGVSVMALLEIHAVTWQTSVPCLLRNKAQMCDILRGGWPTIMPLHVTATVYWSAALFGPR